MLIVIEEGLEATLFTYSTDKIRNSNCGFLDYWNQDGIYQRFKKESEIVANKIREWDQTMYISPLPGHEETVERFIAIGRMKNKDFPFKIYEESL